MFAGVRHCLVHAPTSRSAHGRGCCSPRLLLPVLLPDSAPTTPAFLQSDFDEISGRDGCKRLVGVHATSAGLVGQQAVSATPLKDDVLRGNAAHDHIVGNVWILLAEWPQLLIELGKLFGCRRR